MRFAILILSLFALFNISCTHKKGNTPDFLPLKSATLFYSNRNLVYGSDSVQQSFDLSLPANADRSTTGVIIFIHGGGWSGGGKDDFNNLGMDTFFTRQNCAVITMNYRLTDKYPFPDALDDIGLIINFIRENADSWHVNPDRICLFGRSSGAHLALQYAYTRNGNKSVKAIVDCFGPVNFTSVNVINGQLGGFVEAMLGPYTYNDVAWHNASPIYHMAGAIPTAIMQGTADSLVFADQSITLEDSLLARGVPSIYLSWIGNGHGWNQARWIESRDVLATWLKLYL